MVLKASIFFLLWMSVFNAQAEMNFSYEMKYGDGKLENQENENYSYFENLLDVNTNFGDNIYLFNQFEFSTPPIFGEPKKGLNTFYLEYTTEKYEIKFGDLFELYGMGLSYFSLPDQNIDYDNSVRGIRLNYYYNNIRISSLVGSKKFKFRFFPISREPDSYLINKIALISFDIENDKIGLVQYLYKNQNSILEYDLINKIYFSSTSNIGKELYERALVYFESELSDTIYISEHNMNWYNSFGPFEIFIDKVWNKYNKIYGDEVFGSRFYSSIYTEILGMGITYEYKNYFTPYLIKTISNPPIVYRESNSILASRNNHSINFGDEIGHQIEINKNLFTNTNFIGNFSISQRHKNDEMESINIIDLISMNEVNEVFDYNPFRQFYFEMNGWTLLDRLYYKVGLDHFTEFIDGKSTSAITIPTQWVWKFNNLGSLTIYLETQKKYLKGLLENEEYSNNYFSLSFKSRGNWIITGFFDYELKDEKSDQWPGVDVFYYLNSETQISLFYGSQKGGLVCANGICAVQPGFEDGIKITFRSIF